MFFGKSPPPNKKKVGSWIFTRKKKKSQFFWKIEKKINCKKKFKKLVSCCFVALLNFYLFAKGFRVAFCTPYLFIYLFKFWALCFFALLNESRKLYDPLFFFNFILATYFLKFYFGYLLESPLFSWHVLKSFFV